MPGERSRIPRGGREERSVPRVICCAAFAVLGLFLAPAIASSSPASLDGKWLFSEIIYRGGRHPAPNPDLYMSFEFLGDGTDRLYWTRDGGRTFCDRIGRYVFADGILLDQVTWVNPDNARDCAGDPDMKVGNVTRTPVRREENEILFSLSLGDEPLIYIWKRVLPNGE